MEGKENFVNELPTNTPHTPFPLSMASFIKVNIKIGLLWRERESEIGITYLEGNHPFQQTLFDIEIELQNPKTCSNPILAV